MEWLEIRTALAHLKPPFPHAAVSDARLRWSELAPRFIAEIERIGDGGTTMQDEVAGEYDG